jgi:hypothetical protein
MEQFQPSLVGAAMLDHSECFNSTKRGYTMPAFTFEKISPPVRGPVAPASTSPTEQRQRGIIVQVLGRFVEARVNRTERVESGMLVRRDEPPGK